jgi:hypothetical protein
MSRTFKLLRTVLLLIMLVLPVVAEGQRQRQRDAAPPFRERLFYGGNFGLQFGTITDIQVSPVIGFWVLPRLAVAIGPDYRFYKQKLYGYSSQTHIYGGKAYVEITVLRNINSVIPIGANTDIILHLENNLLSLESEFFRDPPLTSERFLMNTVLGGPGISQQVGKRSALNILVLWALNEPEVRIYSTPEIRFSFMF